MDVREKLVELLRNAKAAMKSENLSCDIARNMFVVDFMMANGVTVQEWVSVKDKLPEKDGQYLIFTTQYFTPDHIDEIDHKDGIEISGYCKRYGFLSKNGIHAKYWRDIPQPPKGE